jgi:hypothetical protein
LIPAVAIQRAPAESESASMRTRIEHLFFAVSSLRLCK